MSISSRIHDTLEQWSEAWKDKLRGWMSHWVKEGAERLFDDFEPALRDEIRPSLLRFREIEGLPEDFKNLIDKTLEEPKFIHIAAILPYIIGIMVGLGMGAAAPMSRVGAYKIDWFIQSARFDPASWITAFRRKYPGFSKIENDLREQGWSEARIEALKFVTQFIPSADEQTLWLAREVYEPEMIDRYGLGDELPVYEETDFDKVGVTPEQMANKWAAHWEHASFMQVIEMLHRGLLSLDRAMPTPPATKEGWAARDAEGEKALFDWYRLVEIPPFWRDRLTAMSWNVPTRVDVRRWWDMRTISEDELYNIYHRQGYHDKDLDNYVKWTKVYTDFPMMMTRFKNGWITEDDIRSWLRGLDIPEDRITQFIEEKTKPEAPARVETERTATATEIMKGVKKELITWAEGVERLGRIGYSSEEAEFKLNVYIGVTEGSPETYMEFVEMTELYRKAIGLESKIPPPELVEAEKALKTARIELQRVTGEGVKEPKLSPYAKAASDAEYRYRQLLLKWQTEGKI